MYVCLIFVVKLYLPLSQYLLAIPNHVKILEHGWFE